MLDVHYKNPRLAEVYDLDSPWSIDREFYLSLAGSPPQSILDLGCGTGLICNAYAAKGHDVTGVDPAPAMLEVACRKPHGKQIKWVQSFAQNYQSDKLFDLIIMTGNAFQVLLEDSDVLAIFAVMRKHLKLSGSIVFESRNPAIDWEKEWDYDWVIESPECTVYESRRIITREKDRIVFEVHYKFPDETLVSKSELRFLSREDIEKHLVTSELRVDKVLGDWDGKPFDEKSSHEMVFIVRAAS